MWKMNPVKTSSIREIPGFYYDEEKKKYFKVTRDHPAPKKKVNKPEIGKNVKARGSNPLVSTIKTLQNREIHATCTQEVRRSMKRSFIQGLELNTDSNTKLYLEEANLTGSVSITDIVPNANQDVLAIISKIKGSDRSILQVYDFHFTNERRFEINASYDISFGQISDVTFAPFKKDVRNQLLVSSLNERLGLFQTLVLWVGDFLVTEGVIKVSKNQTIWSSCFIQNSSVDTRIALGLSTGILMVGPDRRAKKHTLVETSRSDVLSLSCSHTAPTVFSGSRDGYIRTCDLRCLSIVKAVRAKKSVDNLKVLSNETHLLVSTMAGHLELWDMRVWKPVKSFLGHDNTHTLLSIHIDEKEDFVATVGEDCVTRIWDVKTANCLKELASFRTDETGSPIKPSVIFLDQVTRKNISSGFLYGIKDELYYYDL